MQIPTPDQLINQPNFYQLPELPNINPKIPEVKKFKVKTKKN